LAGTVPAFRHPRPAEAKPTDIRIENVSHTYEDYVLRTPLKFGGRVGTRATVLSVSCEVRAVDGRSAKGFGAMPLGNIWSFPSSKMSSDTTAGAMKTLADRITKIIASCPESGHPIDLNHALEPAYLQAAAEISKELHLTEPIPKLCTLVTASPFDAAVHDAFGKSQGLNCYQ